MAWVGWANSRAAEAGPEVAVGGPAACLLAVGGQEKHRGPFPVTVQASIAGTAGSAYELSLWPCLHS